MLKAFHRPREKFVRRCVLCTGKTHTRSLADQRPPQWANCHLCLVPASVWDSFSVRFCSSWPWLIQVIPTWTSPQSQLLTSPRPSKRNWDGTNKTQPEILQQIQYSWGPFTYRYAYIWKADTSNWFFFPQALQRLLRHCILRQKTPRSTQTAQENSMFPSRRNTI